MPIDPSAEVLAAHEAQWAEARAARQRVREGSLEPVQTSGQFPEIEGMFDQAFDEFSEGLLSVIRAGAAPEPQPEELETEIEELTMPKLDLTPAEFDKLKADRTSKQVEVSDEEAARILAARGGRKYTLDDLEPDKWNILKPEEKAEARKQVAEATAAAERGY